MHLPIITAIAAVAGGAGLFVLAKQASKAHFYFSYLTAYLFWLSLGLGALFFVLVQYAVKAGWSIVVRRLAENIMIALPALALLAVPLLYGTHELFHWTHTHVVEADPLLKGKSAYLNLPFFHVRGAVYFVVWSGLALLFYRGSIKQDRSGDRGISHRLRGLSYPGILLFVLTQTFAAFDWLMSLDPHWFSTMHGVYFFAGSMIAIYGFLAVVAGGMRLSGLLTEAVTAEHHQDIGKFLFGFVIFWTYIAYSQYMLYWYANIPEETMWFTHRWTGGWKAVSVALGVGHFAIPFFFLMSRHIKRRPALLTLAGLWLLAMHYLDLYWQVMPTTLHHGPHFSLLDLSAMLAVGGTVLTVFFVQLRRHSMVPARDPRLAESLAHQNF